MVSLEVSNWNVTVGCKDRGFGNRSRCRRAFGGVSVLRHLWSRDGGVCAVSECFGFKESVF